MLWKNLFVRVFALSAVPTATLWGCGPCCEWPGPATASAQCCSSATAPRGPNVSLPEAVGKGASTLTYSLSIRGMTCNECADRVQQSLLHVRDVQRAIVNHQTGQAWVTVRGEGSEQPNTVRREGSDQPNMSTQLATAVRQAGYQPSVNYLLRIQGMTCDTCAKDVEKAMVKVPDVSVANVNYSGAYAVVVPAAKASGLSEALVAAVERAGYRAIVHTGP